MSETPKTDALESKWAYATEARGNLQEALNDMFVEYAEMERDNSRLLDGFTPSINAIELNAQANEEASNRATEAKDIAWSQGVAAGLRLARSFLPNVEAQR